MKPKSTLRSMLSIASSALLTITYAHAATLYWDGGTVNIGTPGNGVSGGTAGDWDTTLTNWEQGNTHAHVAWSGTTNTAFFGGTTGNVTLTAPVTVGGLGFFSDSGYTIIAGASGLTFGTGTNHVRMLSVSSAFSGAAISGTVTGSGSMVFTSVAPDVGSTLTLSGTSAGGWSGTTTINTSTTLALTGLNQSLLNTTGIAVNGGGMTLTSADDIAQDDLDRVNNSAGISSNGGTVTYTTTLAGSTKNFIEILGPVALITGQLNLVNTLDKSAGSQTLALAGLTRAVTTNTSAITFSNAGGLNITTDRIRVNGITTDTAAGEIIGAWATVGTAANSHSDYAVYDSDSTDGYVVPRNIAASAESAWTTAANAYTANAGAATGGSTGLTATRAIAALRSISGANAMTVDNVGDTFSLTSNTFANGDAFILGGTAPAGLTSGNTYYVVGKSGDTFQVAATPVGAAIDFTTDGTAVTATGAITLSSGKNLGTTGILNGGGNTLTILGAGEVTLPSASSGNLHVMPGVGPISIASPITNNGAGVLTLVKNGNDSLTLSGTNSYTGGTVLNSGTLAIGNVNHIGGASANLTFGGTATLAPSAALNFSGGTLTVNGGAYGTITGNGATAFATTTGSGTLRYTSGSNSANLNLGNASGLTGNLEYRLTGNAGYSSSSATVQFSSLGDGVGSVLQVGGGQLDSTGLGQRANIVLNGGAALVFDNRQIEFLTRNASNHTVGVTQLRNDSANPLHTWVINTDLSYQVDQARNFELAGGNPGNNAFNGLISDGNVGGTVSLRKDGGGKWIVSNANTYTGGTTLIAGQLNINNASAIGTGTFTISGTATFDTTTAGAITLVTNNPFTLSGGSPTFIGTEDLNLGTGTVTLSVANRTITVTNVDATLTLGGGVTADNSGNRSLTKAGAGTLALNGAAGTWTGSVNIFAGTLNVGNATALGLGPISFNNSTTGGTLQNTTGSIITHSTAVSLSGNAGVTATITGTAGNDWSFGALSNTQSGNPVLMVNTVNATFSSASISNSGTNRTLVVDGTGTVTFTGAVTNGGSATTSALIKNGAGTLLLNGTNTYNGLTSVNVGTLGGTGTIAGDVTVATAGSLAPGASAGVLSIGGGLDISAPANGGAGKLKFELGANTANSDRIAVTGQLTIGTAMLGFADFTFSNLGWQNGTYKLINFGSISGTLDVMANREGPMIGGGLGALQITGNDLELVVSGVSAATSYDTWASNNGLTGAPGSSTDPAKGADPDKDGRNNLGEFAFNGNPLSGSDNGKVFVLTEDSDFAGDPSSAKELILTVAVRTGTPVFAGSPSPSANQASAGITCRIEGSLDLAGFPTTVNVVSPIITGLPAAGAGYEYRSFSLNGSNGLTGKGFLRAKVTSP